MKKTLMFITTILMCIVLSINVVNASSNNINSEYNNECDINIIENNSNTIIVTTKTNDLYTIVRRDKRNNVLEIRKYRIADNHMKLFSQKKIIISEYEDYTVSKRSSNTADSYQHTFSNVEYDIYYPTNRVNNTNWNMWNIRYADERKAKYEYGSVVVQLNNFKDECNTINFLEGKIAVSLVSTTIQTFAYTYMQDGYAAAVALTEGGYDVVNYCASYNNHMTIAKNIFDCI